MKDNLMKIGRLIAALVIPGAGHLMKFAVIRATAAFALVTGLYFMRIVGIPVWIAFLFHMLQAADAYR